MNIYQIISLLSGLYMTGLIWTIQLVHYPSFYLIDVKHNKKFHVFHQSMMGILAGPVMLIELAACLLNLTLATSIQLHATGPEVFHFVPFILCATCLLSTFFLQVPIHKKLVDDLSMRPDLIAKLVKSNWIRTICWSLKSGFEIYLLFQFLNYL